MNYHESVLLQETVDALAVRKDGIYIDGTLGGAGHAREIINRGGVVLGLDVDKDSITFVEKNFKFEILNLKLKLARANFRNIDKIAREYGFEDVDGILFDLGVSSHQLDTPGRGFSYLKSGPLDMRMDQELGVKAKDLINALSRKELYDLFRALGDEHNAHVISDRIVARRKLEPFETTEDLVMVLADAYGFRDVTDFAKATSGKKVFQALRIAVNDELGSLEEALPKALELLKSGGRLVVISFHSLEDRIVKNAFRDFEEKGKGKIVTKKPILPDELELEENSRSKSSKLRIFEKI